MHLIVYCALLGDPDATSTKRWKAVSPHDAKGAYGQLSLQEGEEVLEVTADKAGWTVVAKPDGSQGAVPTKILGMNTVYLPD